MDLFTATWGMFLGISICATVYCAYKWLYLVRNPDVEATNQLTRAQRKAQKAFEKASADMKRLGAPEPPEGWFE